MRKLIMFKSPADRGLGYVVNEIDETKPNRTISERFYNGEYVAAFATREHAYIFAQAMDASLEEMVMRDHLNNNC